MSYPSPSLSGISPPAISVNNIQAMRVTPSTGGSLTLFATDVHQQYIGLGSNTNQTIVLPVASTMVLGQQFRISNSMTLGTVTINSSGGDFVATIPPLGWAYVTCQSLTGTDASSWIWDRGGQATSGSFSFCGYNTSTDNTPINTVWGTVRTNINGGGNNLSVDGIYTVPNGFAGLYQVSAFYNSGVPLSVTLYAGSNTIGGVSYYSGARYVVNLNAVFKLEVGDTLRFYQSSGSQNTVNGAVCSVVSLF